VKIAWVMGWAAPESWFARLAREAVPAAEHRFFPAGPTALDDLAAAGPFDWTVGYSLGTLLLLGAADRLAGRKVALLAPIFAFAREEGLGGRIARTQVLTLSRWLRHEPLAAVADFYERAYLDIPSGHDPGAPDLLQWGLERLATDRVEPPLPRGWQAWCGARDSLLAARELHALDPAVWIVADGNHHPRSLMRSWMEAGL
jgi:hypothetical protein